jgi:hypothetical protein
LGEVSSQIKLELSVIFFFQGCARAIDRCLSMDTDEKELRHAVSHHAFRSLPGWKKLIMVKQQLYKRVKSHTSSVWAATLVRELLQSIEFDRASEDIPLLDIELVEKKYCPAKKRLMLFDYDVSARLLGLRTKKKTHLNLFK